ncbi:MAG TPA: iron-sulfur cluster-binding domain-containing protein, partial [Allocoleopsis sp.]
FHLAVTLTRLPLEGAWMGLTGRISKSLLNVVVPDLMERSVYACGSEPFMQEVRSILDAMNFPMQHYQEESFGGGKPTSPPTSAPASASATASAPVVPPVLSAETDLPTTTNRHSSASDAAPCTTVAPMVSFMKSERDVMADGSTSILELAEQEGVEIRHACRVGACGACKVMLRQGQVRYDVTPAALTAADQEAGYALACVAVPTERLMVEA